MDVGVHEARPRPPTAEPEYPPVNLSGRSQRYIRFHKAFRHAFKQASERWTCVLYAIRILTRCSVQRRFFFFLNGFRDEDMRSCFPTLYKQNPDLFRDVRQLAIEQGRVNVDVCSFRLLSACLLIRSLTTIWLRGFI